MPFGVGAVAGQDLIVEVDVLDAERDVLLGLPVDRLGQLGVGHRWQRDLLDDDGVAGQRCGDVLGLERMAVEQPPDGSATAAPSMIAPSTMLSGGMGSLPNAATLIALSRRLELDGLDCTRPDVEADDRFRFGETKHGVCPFRKAGTNPGPTVFAKLGSYRGKRRDSGSIAQVRVQSRHRCRRSRWMDRPKS